MRNTFSVVVFNADTRVRIQWFKMPTKIARGQAVAAHLLTDDARWPLNTTDPTYSHAQDERSPSWWHHDVSLCPRWDHSWKGAVSITGRPPHRVAARGYCDQSIKEASPVTRLSKEVRGSIPHLVGSAHMTRGSATGNEGLSLHHAWGEQPSHRTELRNARNEKSGREWRELTSVSWLCITSNF